MPVHRFAQRFRPIRTDPTRSADARPARPMPDPLGRCRCGRGRASSTGSSPIERGYAAGGRPGPAPPAGRGGVAGLLRGACGSQRLARAGRDGAGACRGGPGIVVPAFQFRRRGSSRRRDAAGSGAALVHGRGRCAARLRHHGGGSGGVRVAAAGGGGAAPAPGRRRRPAADRRAERRPAGEFGATSLRDWLVGLLRLAPGEARARGGGRAARRADLGRARRRDPGRDAAPPARPGRRRLRPRSSSTPRPRPRPTPTPTPTTWPSSGAAPRPSPGSRYRFLTCTAWPARPRSSRCGSPTPAASRPTGGRTLRHLRPTPRTGRPRPRLHLPR